METIIHPCQELALAMTLQERMGQLKGKKLCLTWTWNPQHLAAELGHPGCRILNFESETATGPVQNPSIEILPEQTAFLVYTSGTMGRPKGVMQTHRLLRRAAAAHTEAMQYTENDRIPLFAMVSTSQGSVVLSWILLNGAMLRARLTGSLLAS